VKEGDRRVPPPPTPSRPSPARGRTSVVGVLVALCVFLLPAASHAQGFGKNKVNYTQEDWRLIRSEHFDVYFPDGSVWLAEFTARTSEDALTQIEDAWNYKLDRKIPIIVYTSHNTFSETNVIGGRIGETTGGFTEFNRSRVVIPYEGSYAQMRHVIHHELVHALQYNLFTSGSFKTLALSRLVALPLWVVEGLAEFESTGWDVDADNIMRDAVISDYAPSLDTMRYGVFAYKGGQSVYRFLAQTYGRERIAEWLRSIKTTASVEKSFRYVFDESMEEIDEKWHTWLKKQYWPEIAERLSPAEYARPMTDHLEDGSYLNVGGRISPDASQLAYVSTRRGFADIYLMDVETGETERIIDGQQSPDFESLFLLRPGLAWSPTGSHLAIVAKKHGRNALFLFDVVEREVEREYVFDLDAIFTPTWSPDGERMAMIGLMDGWSDIYIVELEDGALTRLTHDPYDERDPDWSPAGSVLAFSSDRRTTDLEYDDSTAFDYGPYNLYTVDVDTHAVAQLTDHDAKDEYAAWSPDGSQLLFVSERSGVGNMYLLDAEGGELTPVTDSLTGAQQIDWSGNGSKVVFSAFQEGGYDLFLLDDPRTPPDGEKVAPTLTELARRMFGRPDVAGAEPTDAAADADEPGEQVQGGIPPEDIVADDQPPGNEGAGSGEPAPTVASSSDGQPTDASNADEAEDERRPPRWSSIVASIPDRLSAVEDDPPKEPNAETPSDDPGVDPNEEVEEDGSESKPRRRKTTKPREYRPKLTVESFGVTTQVSSFLGFSGQAFLSMSDLLGNKRLVLITDQSISSVKNLNAIVQYVQLYNRLNYGVTAFHTRDFFLANERGVGNQVVLVADRNIGFSGLAEYPFSKFSRLEMSAGFRRIERDRVGVRIYDYYRTGPFGETVRQVQEEALDRKSTVPLEVAYIEDTVGYGPFAPADGRRLRVGITTAPGLGDAFLSYSTLKGDYRHYIPFADTQSLALRLSGGTSVGANAQKFFIGGVQSEISPRISSIVDDELRADEIFFPSFEGPLRGASLYEFVGDSFLLANLEWRFRLIDKLEFGWPVPMTFRHIGGAFFADMGSAFQMADVSDPEVVPNRLDSLDDIVGGLGFGTRVHLGVFILRMDAAWRVANQRIARQPRYYWSIGAGF
jgi:Tol biopolymer transport system component